MVHEFLKKTPLKLLMNSPVISVLETDDFSVVKEKFDLHGIRHLPVVNEPGNLVGLISQRDLFRIHSPRKLEDGSWYYDKQLLDGFILKNVMLKEVFTLHPESTLEEAVKAFVQFKYGCIPIIDRYDIPVGIVTNEDVLRYLLKK